MKVYVITKGSYSDYSIYGVAVDKEKAEIMKKYFSDKDEQACIEEYDTDVFEPLHVGKKPYSIYYRMDGSRYCTLIKYGLYAFNPKVRKNKAGGYSICVWATDEYHALKIADDKIAEYKYRKAMKE
jgi:hypothetical protein